jgi:hypothetical protein
MILSPLVLPGERERGRELEREKERVFILKRNERCLGTF